MVDYRRQRDLEDKRAIAGGGIIVNTNIPSNKTEGKISEDKKEDPIEILQKLKTLLDNNLILQDEFDNKKAEVLSRL